MYTYIYIYLYFNTKRTVINSKLKHPIRYTLFPPNSERDHQKRINGLYSNSKKARLNLFQFKQ